MITRSQSSLRFLVAALLFLCANAALAQTNKPARPNILLIMADDLGFSDLGCYGSEIATPNLDSIAEKGLRFSQFYNTARCWPTRGSLLTGYYAQQIRRDKLPGIVSGNAGKRPDWAVLLPKMLEPVGYRSYHSGKWHIDGEPLSEGFDRSRYAKEAGAFFGNAKSRSEKDGAGFYVTRAMAQSAIDDLKHHAQTHAEKPFFHYLAFTAPHFPLHALPEDIAIYSDKYQVGWDAIRKQRWEKMKEIGLLDPKTIQQVSPVERDLGPPYHFPDAFEILGDGEINRPVPWNQLTDNQKAFQAMKMSIHAAMIHRMDIEIGRVLQQIRDMGQEENTLVMFLSDNGASAEIMVRGEGHDPNAPPGSALTYLCLGPGWSTTCNTPFRRHKTWTHEGGTATPMVMSWPAGIKAQGEVRQTPQHVIDVVPTLLELTGAKYPADAPPAPGQSFASHFERDVQSDAREFWWYHDDHKAIRRGDWKAVAPEGEPWELYDLSSDRAETTDLALAQADKLKELVGAWDSQLQAMVKLATDGMASDELRKGKNASAPRDKMSEAQIAAKPKRNQVLLNAETLQINGRHAFIMKPETSVLKTGDKPWIFYGPALRGYPDKNEAWMHQQFLDAGVAVAGIDIGEAYGSPHSQPHFDALYDEMISRGYSARPALLGRSRGGLYVSRFAIERPDRVAGIGGIYPVFDYTAYPGVERAATAYGVTADDLQQRQAELNPIKKADRLAQAKIPVFIIHGTDDKVVPLESNSGALEEAYHRNGQASNITILKIEGQGHNFWQGFFQCQELVDFLIKAAKGS